jgi:hypothetical protein
MVRISKVIDHTHYNYDYDVANLQIAIIDLINERDLRVDQVVTALMTETAKYVGYLSHYNQEIFFASLSHMRELVTNLHSQHDREENQ